MSDALLPAASLGVFAVFLALVTFFLCLILVRKCRRSRAVHAQGEYRPLITRRLSQLHQTANADTAKIPPRQHFPTLQAVITADRRHRRAEVDDAKHASARPPARRLMKLSASLHDWWACCASGSGYQLLLQHANDLRPSRDGDGQRGIREK